MNHELIATIINTIVVPEIAAFIRRRQAETGTVPTDEEIVAELHMNADRVIAVGTAWLASHPNEA